MNRKEKLIMVYRSHRKAFILLNSLVYRNKLLFKDSTKSPWQTNPDLPVDTNFKWSAFTLSFSSLINFSMHLSDYNRKKYMKQYKHHCSFIHSLRTTNQLPDFNANNLMNNFYCFAHLLSSNSCVENHRFET